MKSIKCNPKNYGAVRSRDKVKFIVIHYTANKNDTAENNGNYFKNNAVKASAHFFIDREGNIVKSVPLNRIAWSVGGKKYPSTKGAKYYGVCTNANSVSIELCDIVDKQPSEAQIQATIKCIKYIRKYCANIVSMSQIIRHYDVTGKLCPGSMIDTSKWNKFKARLVW